MKVLLLLLSALLGCNEARNPTCLRSRWNYYVGDDKTYKVTPMLRTPAGTPFDPSGQPIDGALIDRLTDEVRTCLDRPIVPTSFVVKIPSDWVLSCDGSQEELSAIAPAQGCLDKGLTPTNECPCRWRAVIQCPNVIVATPSLYLYKDALVRFVTGSTNPWADPVVGKCAAPTTPPLSHMVRP